MGGFQLGVRGTLPIEFVTKKFDQDSPHLVNMLEAQVAKLKCRQ